MQKTERLVEGASSPSAIARTRGACQFLDKKRSTAAVEHESPGTRAARWCDAVSAVVRCSVLDTQCPEPGSLSDLTPEIATVECSEPYSHTRRD